MCISRVGGLARMSLQCGNQRDEGDEVNSEHSPPGSSPPGNLHVIVIDKAELRYLVDKLQLVHPKCLYHLFSRVCIWDVLVYLSFSHAIYSIQLHLDCSDIHLAFFKCY